MSDYSVSSRSVSIESHVAFLQVPVLRARTVSHITSQGQILLLWLEFPPCYHTAAVNDTPENSFLISFQALPAQSAHLPNEQRGEKPHPKIMMTHVGHMVQCLAH